MSAIPPQTDGTVLRRATSGFQFQSAPALVRSDSADVERGGVIRTLEGAWAQPSAPPQDTFPGDVNGDANSTTDALAGPWWSLLLSLDLLLSGCGFNVDNGKFFAACTCLVALMQGGVMKLCFYLVFWMAFALVWMGSRRMHAAEGKKKMCSAGLACGIVGLLANITFTEILRAF